MMDTVRKAVLMGIGAADMAAEGVQKMIDDFVARGDMSVDQGKEFYQDVMSRIEQRGRIQGEQMRRQVRDVLEDAGIPDREQIAALETRIDEMERKLDQLLSRVSPRGEELPAEQDR